MPPAAPRTYTGRCGRSRARSSVVRMMQHPPSEITQQSSLCSGSATSFDPETSSTVIGSRYIAFGISGRVLARLHRDRCQLFGRRTVRVHVALRSHRVRADERHAGRDLVRHRERHRGAAPRRPAIPPVPSVRPNDDSWLLPYTIAIASRRRRPGWRGTRASPGTRSSNRRTTSTPASGAGSRGTPRAAPRACRRSRRSRARRRRAAPVRHRRARGETPALGACPFRSGVTGPSDIPTPTTHTFRCMGRERSACGVTLGPSCRSRDHVAHNRNFWDADADAYQAVHGTTSLHRAEAWGCVPATRSRARRPRRCGRTCGARVGLRCRAVVGRAHATTARAVYGTRPLRRAAAPRARPLRERERASRPRPRERGTGAVRARQLRHGVLRSRRDELLRSATDGARGRPCAAPGWLARVLRHPPARLPHVESTRRNAKRASCISTTTTLGRMDFDDGTIDWVLPPGAWIRLFRGHGFEVEDLIELRAPCGCDHDVHRLRTAGLGAAVARGADLEGTTRAREDHDCCDELGEQHVAALGVSRKTVGFARQPAARVAASRSAWASADPNWVSASHARFKKRWTSTSQV